MGGQGRKGLHLSTCWQQEVLCVALFLALTHAHVGTVAEILAKLFEQKKKQPIPVKLLRCVCPFSNQELQSILRSS